MKFDRLAPHYDWLEAVTAGDRLQRARVRWMGALEGCRHVLSVGEGHGRFAEAFVRRFPNADLTCVEGSPAMLARARRRVGPTSARVHWECSDFLEWRSNRKFDAIVTCFFLDCFPPATLAKVVSKLAEFATDDAVWLVTDFAVPSKGPARWRASAIHSLMYAFFRLFVSLPARHMTSPAGLLNAQGFGLCGRTEYEWGLLSSEIWRRK